MINCFPRGGMLPQSNNHDNEEEDESEIVGSYDPAVDSDDDDCDDDCDEEEDDEEFATNNPADYYFVAEANLEPESDITHATLVTVVPKTLWDAYGDLSQEFLSTKEDGLLNIDPRFEEVSEGLFGFRGKISEAVVALQATGMKLNPELADSEF